jgi:hypothetical protein
MSVLDRVRAKFSPSMAETCKTSGTPSAGFAGSEDVRLNSLDCSSAASARTSADVAQSQGRTALSPAQEAAMQEVLALLTANPAVRRTFVTRFEHDALVVTLAIRGVGTGELLIPAERFNPQALDDFAALLACMEGGASA